MEPEAGFEPATCSLRVSCSTPELPGRAKRNRGNRQVGLVEHTGHEHSTCAYSLDGLKFCKHRHQQEGDVGVANQLVGGASDEAYCVDVGRHIRILAIR
jgi:hypothetical protein